MVAPLQKVVVVLTGRVRARPGWFGRQVLQVQERSQYRQHIPPPPGRAPDPAWEAGLFTGQPWFTWRDATWHDVHAVGELTSALHQAAYGFEAARHCGAPRVDPDLKKAAIEQTQRAGFAPPPRNP